MESATKTHVDQFDVADRLNTLGLTLDILHDTIRAGYHGWSSCTDLDPPMFPGISMWANMVRRIRQRLLPEGWTHSDEGNYSTVRSPNGEIALAVATGDENTGFKDANPTTQCPKGPRTVNAININNAQLLLDFGYPDENEIQQLPYSEGVDAATWILLVNRNGLEIRAELSHPFDMDENQRITGWHERIILPTVEFAPDSEFDFGPEKEHIIDIPIKRRV